jgi:hypothetical protein
MLRLKQVQRAVPLAWLLLGCNAILGIEERDLVEGGGAAGSVGQSGSLGVAGSSSEGGEPGSPGGRDGAGGSSSAGTAGSGFGGTPAQGDGGAGGDETGGTTPFGGSGGSAGGTGAGGKGGNGGNAGTFSTGGGGGTSPAVDCSAGITATSSGEAHTHTLTLPAADIAASVTKTYATSVNSGHNHFVRLDATDFAALKSGGEVKKKSCSGGDHQFVLKCGGGGSVPVVPTAQECPDMCGASMDMTCN